MKVLLIKDVKGLGKAGEIKEVKDGYGNNFLIGKGFALAATTEVLRKFEAGKKKGYDTEYENQTSHDRKTDPGRPSRTWLRSLCRGRLRARFDPGP